VGEHLRQRDIELVINRGVPGTAGPLSQNVSHPAQVRGLAWFPYQSDTPVQGLFGHVESLEEELEHSPQASGVGVRELVAGVA
jgi:hypothetical protein